MKRWPSLIFNIFAPQGIPLAWRQLTRDKKRFAAAIVGVTFGLFLMIFQLGMYTAALRGVVLPHSALKGELVITSRNFTYFYLNHSFPRSLLYQLQGVPGVASVAPVCVDFGKWKNTTTGVDTYIAILAINPSRNPFIHPELTSQIQLLTNGENVLFDRQSKEVDFGKVAAALQEKSDVTSEVDQVRVRVKGLFSMGRTLAATGHIVISDEGLARIQPRRLANMINIGLVTLRAGVDPEEIRHRLSELLPKDLRVITSKEFQQEEQDYWISRTAIGFVFRVGMLVGLFVGAIVVYQILYTDVMDYLREYATLKALGITNMFLFRIVMTEAVILLVASAFPSTILSNLLFHEAWVSAGIPAKLAVSELLAVFALTAVVWAFAGLLATRRLRTSDPADIY
ncbi:MAG: FtsX-like permease family protein [Deltaproteobacteria bacterium]|nr:FtsX-like permease family protein [Deltaproteobacteria bacterium]